MLHKSYIAVPFALGLVCVAVSTANAVKERKETELLGNTVGVFCNLSQDTCTNIKERQKMSIKIIPPLGLSVAVNKQEINCLARNITQEAVSGYTVDRIAVAYGTINRVKQGFARSICAVISQAGQMSWYANYAKRNAPPRPENVELAKKILTGDIPNPSTECPIVSWYNNNLDSKNSYNFKGMIDPKKQKCVYKPFGTPHFYIGWR
jgi:spore germination cell wall hydrolase CwlJ-like protein